MVFKTKEKMEKPIKANPAFYAHCYFELLNTAIDHGYNLLIHGSLNRDMDLVCVPWVDNPKPNIDLLNAFCDVLGIERQKDYMFSILPGKRNSYVINLNRGGKFNGYVDSEIYLDISFTPLPNAILG